MPATKTKPAAKKKAAPKKPVKKAAPKQQTKASKKIPPKQSKQRTLPYKPPRPRQPNKKEQSLAQQVFDLADRKGMSIDSVAAYKALLADHGISIAAVTAPVIAIAKRLAREDYNNFLRRVESINEDVRRRRETHYKRNVLPDLERQRQLADSQNHLRQNHAAKELQRLEDDRKLCVNVNGRYAAPKTPKGEKTPKEPKPKTTGSKARIKIFGLPAGQVLQWMAINGYKAEEMSRAAKVLGEGEGEVAPATIKVCITDSKNPKYSRPATIDKKQAATIKKAARP